MKLLVESYSVASYDAFRLEGRSLVMEIATPQNETMVRAYVTALSRRVEAVDDLSQEVFVRAIERIDRLHSPEKLGAFLRGIARRVVQEHFRQTRRERLYFSYDEATAKALVADESDVFQQCHDRHVLSFLSDVMAELPVVSRRMLEMRYHDGLNRDSDMRETA